MLRACPECDPIYHGRRLNDIADNRVVYVNKTSVNKYNAVNRLIIHRDDNIHRSVAPPKKYTMEHTVCNPDAPHASTRAALKTPTADCPASSAYKRGLPHVYMYLTFFFYLEKKAGKKRQQKRFLIYIFFIESIGSLITGLSKLVLRALCFYAGKYGE